MSRRHDGAVVLVVERRRTEVNQSNVSTFHPLIVLLLPTKHTHTHTAVNRYLQTQVLLAYAVITTAIRLRFNGRSTAIRLLIKGH